MYLLMAKYQNTRTNNIIIKSDNPDLSNDDIVKTYDYRKIYDPLENPTKRVDKSSLPHLAIKQLFDISTRGETDNFQQVGVLVAADLDNTNKLIKLFGRKKYPHSETYEYYVQVNNGNDNIKFPLKQTKEIFNKDEVHIDELNRNYTASIYENDSPRYYPNIL